MRTETDYRFTFEAHDYNATAHDDGYADLIQWTPRGATPFTVYSRSVAGDITPTPSGAVRSAFLELDRIHAGQRGPRARFRIGA